MTVPASPAPRSGPRRITLVTSPERCNLRCRMCRDHSPLARDRAREPELALERALAVLEERRGSALDEVIPSTRGEPLLWPGLPVLLDRCVEQGVLVNVTTNGSFPGGVARWAPPLAAACSDVKLSWNGATAATAEAIMEGLSFEAALVGARALVAARDALRARGRRACTVSFQVTAQEANVAELPEIVRLAARLGVDRVKVNQLQVHFAALAPGDLRRDAASRARWAEAAAAATEVARAAGVRIENAAPLPDGDAPRGRCPFLGREAWVLADGSFAPCPSPRPPALPAAETIGEWWASGAYAALASGYEARAECARCPFRRAGGA